MNVLKPHVSLIRGARPEDRAGVEALLSAAGLPTEGVEEHFASFFVDDDCGRIFGAAGLELYGANALLRSVVVAETAKGVGLGSALIRRALDEAAARDVRAVYLLTTSAAMFFPRFGFEVIARNEVPANVHASRELRYACPSSAVPMRRLLPR